MAYIVLAPFQQGYMLWNTWMHGPAGQRPWSHVALDLSVGNARAWICTYTSMNKSVISSCVKERNLVTLESTCSGVPLAGARRREPGILQVVHRRVFSSTECDYVRAASRRLTGLATVQVQSQSAILAGVMHSYLSKPIVMPIIQRAIQATIRKASVFHGCTNGFCRNQI